MFQCSGQNINGNKCNRYGYKMYCWQHETCAGETINGEKCQRKCNQKYCWQHGGGNEVLCKLENEKLNCPGLSCDSYDIFNCDYIQDKSYRCSPTQKDPKFVCQSIKTVNLNIKPKDKLKIVVALHNNDTILETMIKKYMEKYLNHNIYEIIKASDGKFKLLNNDNLLTIYVLNGVTDRYIELLKEKDGSTSKLDSILSQSRHFVLLIYKNIGNERFIQEFNPTINIIEGLEKTRKDKISFSGFLYYPGGNESTFEKAQRHHIAAQKRIKELIDQKK